MYGRTFCKKCKSLNVTYKVQVHVCAYLFNTMKRPFLQNCMKIELTAVFLMDDCVTCLFLTIHCRNSSGYASFYLTRCLAFLHWIHTINWCENRKWFHFAHATTDNYDACLGKPWIIFTFLSKNLCYALRVLYIHSYLTVYLCKLINPPIIGGRILYSKALSFVL